MSVRRLRYCQAHDPAKGCFMVNPAVVKDSHGKVKMHRGKPVHRSANHVELNTRGEVMLVPHPYSYEYVVNGG